MTPTEFRAIALSLPGTAESSHMNHPDFRVGGKIIATLGYPSRGWGCVSLPAGEQARVTQAEPEVFVPVKGAWGRAGATQVYLRLARKRSVRAALKTAWENRVLDKPAAAAKKPVKKSRPRKSATTRAARRSP